jgi:hypothetical protein
MKKSILILALLFLVFSTKAQLINPGFETWTNDALVPSAMNPNSGDGTTGWWDFNYFNSPVLGSSPVSVTRCTDTVHSGSYSVRLQTKVYTPTSWGYFNAWGTPFIGHPYNDTLGILFNGNASVNSQTYVPGIPYTQKFSDFRFYYQYRPAGIDTAICRVLLVKQRVPVAGGVFKTHVATGSSGWQQAVVTMTYVSSVTPDTMWVLYSSSSLDKYPKPGSTLWLDDVSVTFATGITEALDSEDDLEIFPNPSNGVFSVQVNGNREEQHLEVFNVLGSRVFSTETSKQHRYTVDLSNYPKGVYYVKVVKGGRSLTRKIVVH